MKKIFVFLIGLLFIVSCTRIDAGYKGLKVNLLGSDKGAIQEYGPGSYGIGPNIEWYKFPMFVKTYVWTKDPMEGSPNDESFTFQTKEGLSINADVGISIQIKDESGVPTRIFTTYRRGIDELIDSVIRNEVRDSLNRCAAKYTVEDIIGEGKATLLDEVLLSVRNKFNEVGINIVSLSWVNAIRPPESVVAALNAKVEVTQLALQRENEVRTAEAEARKKVAEAQGEADSILLKATAQAKANSLLSMSMTDRLIQLEWITKWNGVLPTVTNDGSNIIDLRSLK